MMKNKNQTTPRTLTRKGLDDTATVKELADVLHVSKKSIYLLVKRGEIPGATRVGKSIRISIPAVRRWMSGDSPADPVGETQPE